MKICRYQLRDGEPVRLGVVRGDAVHDVTAVTEDLPALRWPFPPGDQIIAHLDALRPQMKALADSVEGTPIAHVLLRNPVANPGKFVCGAGNFEEVLAAGGHPRRLGLLFKMTSAAAGPSDGVVLRWPERTTFHEMEIAIVIGKAGTEIPASKALDHVAGYCIGLDMTMQGSEFPSFGKSFDTYGVMGPWLTTRDEIADPDTLDFRLTVNGEDRQVDNTRRLVLGIADLVEHAASVMTLHPGDVIFSGTPPRSIGPVVPGDTMYAWAEGLGEMTVAVTGGPGRKTPLDGMR
ncbi:MULTISPECIES: fumarylacetoacetate hydrolase family protein [Novosphingobium]|jgi:2-keto-4-pentenoate hydratase/2-oxohepta-3-ene-1,7-dioic acid hydratase in catechol pathway|uniref:fumarylacetoacetate hydrolase family protein n=1 Tax=Novosphingobium TaxID=165696 RepID=UPI0022F24D8C|nr:MULTISPECIES: fumarylacetoacetate hydrolase family protein [Novosphingobium]GLK44120.1 2-hydroxyhepta-2,4-diene-1,7-dioate isomerase [Novosphingobium resinovorum]